MQLGYKKELAAMESVKYFNTLYKEEEQTFAKHFRYLLQNQKQCQNKKIIIICIGSDRSTGDSFGPLTGTFLANMQPSLAINFGNLDNPVHALNLKEVIDHVNLYYPEDLVVAIDACLGSREKVGFVELGVGQLFPGSSMNKALPPVGDIFVNGIVNAGGLMDFVVLQSTRLGAVLPMARFIANGIHFALAGEKLPGEHNLCHEKSELVSLYNTADGASLYH